MKYKSLKIQQLDEKFAVLYNVMKKVQPPSIGWVKSIRSALGISLEQLGKKLSLTRQGVSYLENSEKDGSISLNSLRELAAAMDLELIYALVPKDKSLEKLIDRKARDLATQIVQRTSANMKLEDQQNSQRRLKKAIEERTQMIKNEMPKTLWD